MLAKMREKKEKKKEMKKKCILQLIALADALDERGSYKEASELDKIIEMAQAKKKIEISIMEDGVEIDKQHLTRVSDVRELAEKLQRLLQDDTIGSIKTQAAESKEGFVKWMKKKNYEFSKCTCGGPSQGTGHAPDCKYVLEMDELWKEYQDSLEGYE